MKIFEAKKYLCGGIERVHSSVAVSYSSSCTNRSPSSLNVVFFCTVDVVVGKCVVKVVAGKGVVLPVTVVVGECIVVVTVVVGDCIVVVTVVVGECLVVAKVVVRKCIVLVDKVVVGLEVILLTTLVVGDGVVVVGNSVVLVNEFAKTLNYFEIGKEDDRKKYLIHHHPHKLTGFGGDI